MKPYYQDKWVTIYNGDCNDVLADLRDETNDTFRVDLVLTDPPYGLGIAKNPFRQKFNKDNWDDSPVDSELLGIIIGMGKDAIIWGGNFFGLPAHQCFLVWDKYQPQDFSSSMCEQAWTTLKMPAKIYRKWAVSHEKYHPTQKPCDLMRWCILFTEAKLILDPFMGSGTTCRAAKDLKRYSIGIEIEEKYCEIAARRCSQEVMELV